MIEILKTLYTCILHVTDKTIDLIQCELQIYFIDVIINLYYTIAESNGPQRIFKSDVIYIYTLVLLLSIGIQILKKPICQKNSHVS